MPFRNYREETTRFAPRHVSSVELASMLLGEKSPDSPKIMEGISSLTVDFATNNLVLVGSADRVRNLEQLLRLLDKKPQEIRLEFRLQKDGKDLWKGEIAAARNNKRIDWKRDNFILNFMPHINGDNTVSLQFETYSQKRFLRVSPGRPTPSDLDEGTLIVVATPR